jgi:hypothetical protein
VNFIVRILFSGLMALIPSQDGTELTVVLLNVEHAYHTSDGASVPHHNPFLIARAGNCTGQCPKRDASVATPLFPDKSTSAAADALEAAVAGGGAWLLSGSELSVRRASSNDPELPALVLETNVRGMNDGQPLMIPTTSAEREDLSWIASLKEVCPTCTFNPDLLATQPPTNLVAARLRLRTGKVFTYSVARIGTNVTPVHFTRLDGSGSPAAYSQAIASWVGADIEVSGDSIEIVEEKFDGGTGRSMILEPDANDHVEIAVLNLPSFVPPASTANLSPQAGKHFEAYYDLTVTPPAREERLIPRAGAASSTATYAEVEWQAVHPQATLWSDLLNALRLDVGRGPYDRVLCPPIKQ